MKVIFSSFLISIVKTIMKLMVLYDSQIMIGAVTVIYEDTLVYDDI